MSQYPWEYHRHIFNSLVIAFLYANSMMICQRNWFELPKYVLSVLKITEFPGTDQHRLYWTFALILLAAVVSGDGVYAPSVVAVLKRQVLSCSGFLLNKKYVGVRCSCISSLEQPGRPRLNGLRFKDYDFVVGEKDSRRLTTAQHKRKPQALLTHPYCENEPPVVYDVGIAVMDEPFPTIHDIVEIYDFLSTNPQGFAEELARMFSWKRPEDAPNCTLAGWKIFSTPEKNQLMTMEMITLPPTDCKEKWRKEDPTSHPPQFNFSYPEQFCLVTRNVSQDATYLPNDGPLVCLKSGSQDRSFVYVGQVIYGPERRQGTREVPVVTQSLAVMVEWIVYDTYFDSVGCYGRDADNCLEDKFDQKFGKSAAVRNTMGSYSVIILIVLVHTLRRPKNWKPSS